jgi:hypothetical protein
MAKTRPIYKFASNTPKALINAYIEAERNARKLEKVLGVDHHYICKLLRNGEEPTNPELRVKLFLPKVKRKPPTPRPEEWHGQKRVKRNIARMAKNLRNSFKEIIS